MTKRLRLNHLNLPASNPEALGDWYVSNLDFRRDGRFLWSDGTILVFTPGIPMKNDQVHFGFRLDREEDVHTWAFKLREAGAKVGTVRTDSGLTRVFARDPEGNRFELFWEAGRDYASQPSF